MKASLFQWTPAPGTAGAPPSWRLLAVKAGAASAAGAAAVARDEDSDDRAFPRARIAPYHFLGSRKK